eukprot:CAMPEP_0173375830 /NCGR_PEP_ID=MMETSP1144-20121109/29849_1 /TAXON_ID=483371 /ORGANISM="non described non described, Strain CCMP2298" /LENGTH=108 /DNA_ID=CAMNT_0014328315 /DNA_START=264 /DNA_END=590 /DNA_ORIENTATION=+
MAMKTGKRAWGREEDAALLGLTSIYSKDGQWAQIATHMNRTGKQCRERYFNHLRADIRKDEWTEREDTVLDQQQAVFGNQWSTIALPLLPLLPLLVVVYDCQESAWPE